MPHPEYRALQPSLTHADLQRREARAKETAERQAKMDKKTQKEKLLRSRQTAAQAVKDRLAVLESEDFPDASVVEIIKIKGVPVLRKPKNMAPIIRTGSGGESSAYLKVLKVRQGYPIPPSPSADETSPREVLWIGRTGLPIMGELISKADPEAITYSIPGSDDSLYFADPADGFEARNCLAVSHQSLRIVNPNTHRWLLDENSFYMGQTIDTFNRAAEHLGGVIERQGLAALRPVEA